MDIAAFVAARRAGRTAAGLNVKTSDGKVFSFATEASRDDFIRRATNAGREPMIVPADEKV
jgi:hypothetical protein